MFCWCNIVTLDMIPVAITSCISFFRCTSHINQFMFDTIGGVYQVESIQFPLFEEIVIFLFEFMMELVWLMLLHNEHVFPASLFSGVQRSEATMEFWMWLFVFVRISLVFLFRLREKIGGVNKIYLNRRSFLQKIHIAVV